MLSLGVWKQAVTFCLLPPFVTLVVEKEKKEFIGFMECTEMLETVEERIN